VNQSAGIRQIFTGSKSLSLFVLGLCEFVRGALLFYILPIYVHGVLGLSGGIVGYALAAHYTMDTGLRSPSGWLTDRFGQRKTLLVALSVGWLGIWVLISARSDWSVILGSAMMGLGMSAVWPAVISRVTSGLTSSSYATAMGGVMMAWLLGTGAGTVSMSFLLGDHVKSGFASLLVVWMVSIVLAIFVMEGYHHHAHHRKRLHILSVLKEVQSVRLLIPGMFVQTFAMGVLLPIFLLFERFQLGISGKTYSFLIVAGGAATVLLQIPMGRLVDKYGYKVFLVIGFATCSLILPVIVYLHTLWLVFITVAGLGTGYALILPAWNSVMARSVSENRRASMFGIFMTVEGLGMAIGPLVGGKLWQNVGPTAPFWAAAGIFFVMMLFYSFAPLQHLFINHKQEAYVQPIREVL
jgi:DHA1 family multidrug resistance protein-like MFS transporter